MAVHPNLDDFVSVLAQLATSDGTHATVLPNLTLFRSSCESVSNCAMYEPSVVLVAQGEKQVELGDQHFAYDEANYLVSAIDVPVAARITRASAQRPYLCMVVKIDLPQLGEMVARLGPGEPGVAPRAVGVSPMTGEVLEAALRLLKVAAAPKDATILGPLAEQELLYRVLTGALGPMLRRFLAAGSPTKQIAWAIGWLRTHFDRPLRIEELAQQAHMSASSLHHHFKALTHLSPLQFQKQLRLQEARRLMMAERLDAASAAERVGYESPSHFSRDYARRFGAPPGRDVAQLRRQA